MYKKKILVFGLPGSGKTTLSKKLSEWLPAVHLNADEVRAQADDWDFSAKGRIRQASRMIHLAQRVNFEHVILDFVCPKKFIRNSLGVDIVVFMDTISESRYPDTNQIFEFPDPSEKIKVARRLSVRDNINMSEFRNDAAWFEEAELLFNVAMGP